MNKDEIKKALELCQIGAISTCKDCPYTENCDGVRLYKDALALITEQENEIDLLQMQMKDVVNHADTFLAEATKFEAENKKLKAENKMRLINLNTALDDIKQAKIDVLNELKEKYGLYYLSVLGVKEKRLSDVLDKMIEELKK